MNLGSFLIPIIGILLVSKLFPGLFRKLGVKEISFKRIEYLKSQKYPKYYSWIYNILITLAMGIAVFVMLVDIVNFSRLQYLLFGQGSLFISSGEGGVGLMSILVLIGATTILIPPIEFLTYHFGSNSFKDWRDYASVKQGLNFSYSETLKLDIIIILLMVVFYFLLSPLIYLSLHDYSALYKDKFVHNSLSSLQTMNYQLNEINNIHFTLKSNKESYYPAAIVTLTNSKEFEFDARFGSDLINLKKAAQELNLPLTIDNLS